MNRYNARSGAAQRVSERSFHTKPNPPQKTAVNAPATCAKQPVKNRDIGDLWVLAVFFLLYLESRDTDFLIILAVLAFSMFDLGDVLKNIAKAVN